MWLAQTEAISGGFLSITQAGSQGWAALGIGDPGPACGGWEERREVGRKKDKELLFVSKESVDGKNLRGYKLNLPPTAKGLALPLPLSKGSASPCTSPVLGSLISCPLMDVARQRKTFYNFQAA